MSYLVSDLKNDMTRKGHGTTTDDLRDVNGLINEAARQVLTDVDPPETERITLLQNAVFDDITRMSSPSDLKGDKIIDIRPQAGRTEYDNFTQYRSPYLDLKKAILDNAIAVEYDDGTKYLRIKKVLNKGILLNECESTTANGTWSAAGGAANLATDSVYFVSGAGALKFDVGASGGYLENTTMSQIDLTDHVGQSSLFIFLYIPSSFTPANLTNVNLIWGSDTSANYYTKNATANFDGTAFHSGWNLIQFDWNGLTAIGSPTAAAYDSLRVTLTTTASGSGFRLDSIYSRLPAIYEIDYYSKFLFRTSAGVFSETVTEDTDIINLDTDGYNLLLDQCALLAAQQRAGRDGGGDITFFDKRYTVNAAAYRTKYPSKVIPAQSSYYRIRK